MFTRFMNYFFVAIRHVKVIILALIGSVVAGAAAVTLVEKMPFADTLYFAFVTGLTIGYGDIVVKSPFGRFVAILIGFIGILFTGSLLIEVIFSLDGLGLLGFEAAIDRDYPVMFATLYFFTLVGLVMGLVADLTYAFVDPRIDFEYREV